ncbi:hypothetical protein Tco_0442056 [Tanacetum coccineum]
MASLNHHLNPLFSIKECSFCGALYTRNCGCSKGNLEDKILVPKPSQNYATCGDPVDGLYCRSCAFVRKCLNEGWNCLNCGDPVHGLYCRQCALIRKTLEEVFQDFQDTSESSDDDTNVFCGEGAHIGYNCPPKAPIISNPEPCNQTIDELPQTLPSFDSTCYSEKENSLPYISKPNFVDDSPNVLNPPPQPPMYSCEFCGNDARYGHYCTP